MVISLLAHKLSSSVISSSFLLQFHLGTDCSVISNGWPGLTQPYSHRVRHYIHTHKHAQNAK